MAEGAPDGRCRLDYGAPGPYAVVTEDGEWHDPGRDRRLGWRRYRPQATVAEAIVVHSHGLGGSRTSGADWLAHWASWGIAGVAVQHPGSDVDALASPSPLALRRLLRTAVDAASLAARQRDLSFVLDCLAGEAPTAIGLCGHSYGPASVLRLIGERRGGDDLPADPRVAAAALFSPSARGGSLPFSERFAGVALPCLNLTGSRDDGIGPGDIRAADRCLPFAHMPGPHKRLLVLDGVTHRDLAGQADAVAIATRRTVLQAATTAFWLAYLAADGDAGTWLDAELPRMLGVGDRLQTG